jgi:hypothetical protein
MCNPHVCSMSASTSIVGTRLSDRDLVNIAPFRPGQLISNAHAQTRETVNPTEIDTLVGAFKSGIAKLASMG